MTIDIRDYDLATLYRFKLFYDNCHWVNQPNLYEVSEIRNNHIYEGKRIEFPIILLRRVSTPIMYKDAQNSWAVGRTGDRRGRDISIAPNGKGTIVDMTMVQTNYELRYVLDVLSFERDNFDDLVVEVQENLFRYPYLMFENWVSSDLRMLDPQVSGMATNITWESTEDNTDLESFNSQTPFYRASITFTIRAYIYRKYSALLLEEVLNGYRVLDHNKITQQVVEESKPKIPQEVVPPKPDAVPTGIVIDGLVITTEIIAVLDGVGSVGMFLYREVGITKPYGSEIDGKWLSPISLNAPNNGFFSYSHYDDVKLTGTWKLLTVAQTRSADTPCIVMAVKVSEGEDGPDHEDDPIDDPTDDPSGGCCCCCTCKDGNNGNSSSSHTNNGSSTSQSNNLGSSSNSGLSVTDFIGL